MGRLLIVGRESFLARATAAALPESSEVSRPSAVQIVGHDQLDDPDLLDGVDRAIVFARHPAIMEDGYDLQRDDPDLRLARRIGTRPIRQLMCSTRKVYLPAAGRLAEDAALGPRDAYGRNKQAIERALASLLGERLTILRIANVFGFEHIPGRTTFMARLLSTLAQESLVRLDVSPFVARDFLPVEDFARMLAKLLHDPPGGVLNIGSGIATPLGRLALDVIAGYGRGDLLVTSPVARDGFVLDVGRLTSACGAPCSVADIHAAALRLGRRLRGATG